MAGILFTIEQIELIRRLRASGITRDQVMLAFEQLDRLDGELGNTGMCPVMPALMPRGRHNYGAGGGGNDTHGGGAGGGGGVSERGHNGMLSSSSSSAAAARAYMASREPPQLQNASSNDSATGDCGPHNGESVASPPTTTTAGGGGGAKLPSELTIIPISASASPQGSEDHGGGGGGGGYGGGGGGSVPSLYPPGVVPMQYLMNPHEFLQEESGDIDDLKRKGEAAILSEIRNFVMRYNIKQTMIAEMTKLSQAYVSRFFRGDIADMSDRTKNTFYMWYLTCKNNPWKLAQLCPNSGVKRMVSETGDLIPLKRERFTFKSAHLAVLERYYERDPYPDAQTREQIVEECNEAVERPERPLTEREKVSLPVVNNWFNNRRKEAKKQLRQQHAAAMAAAASAGGLGGLGSVPPGLGGGGGVHQKSPFSVGPPLWGAPSLYPQVGSSAAALAAALPSCAAITASAHVEASSMRGGGGGGSDQGDSGGPEGDSDQGDSDTSQEEDSTSLPSYGHDSEPTDFTTGDNSLKPVIKQEMPSSQCVSSMEQDGDG